LMRRIQAAVRPKGSVPVFLIYGRAALAFVLIYKREAWAGRVPDRNIKTH
jgi:hypothetical protein